MHNYLTLVEKCLYNGTWKENRTGIRTLGYIGDYCRYDLSEGFPAVTTKKLAFKSVVGEMLGFLRGYDNAKKFRELGCQVWNANANENEEWVNNPWRQGEDDLGRIYGVQARDWHFEHDQLKTVYEQLKTGEDNRRMIVSHWNPSDFHRMALPPCHVMYQFSIDDGKLHLSMYQRSCDLPLGVPFNVAGYSWLLSVMAHILKMPVGCFHHFMADIHIYENQVELAKEQITRVPFDLPKLEIHENVQSFEDLETWVTPREFKLVDYEHHPHISYLFAV